MTTATTLSEAARALFHACVDGRNPDVNDATRPAYRELAAHGLMIPLHSFSRGDEALYRFTEEG